MYIQSPILADDIQLSANSWPYLLPRSVSPLPNATLLPSSQPYRPRNHQTAISYSPATISHSMRPPVLSSSQFRPRVAAAERIFEWTGIGIPSIGSNIQHPVSESTRRAAVASLKAAFAPATLLTYGAGLSRWAEWCDKEGIPEHLRFPIPEDLLWVFLGSFAGLRGASALDNWVKGLKAWHRIHGYELPVSTRINLVLRGIKNTVPPECTRPLRPPVSTDMLACLRERLDFTDTFDVACFAAALATFWGPSRLGEMLIRKGMLFDKRINIKRNDVRSVIDRFGNDSRELRIPFTKTTAFLGAVSILSHQRPDIDPVIFLDHHLLVNDRVPADGPLFAFNSASASEGWQSLSKESFIERCNTIWASSGFPSLSGHSFRIGGTNELLSAGISPEFVKKAGRWSSDAFGRYWRNFSEILPMHIQNAHLHLTS